MSFSRFDVSDCVYIFLMKMKRIGFTSVLIRSTKRENIKMRGKALGIQSSGRETQQR